jgi:formate dehydrogenase major subunit
MKKAMEKLDLLVVIDPYPDHDGGHARPQGRRLPAAGLDAVRDLRLGDGVQPLAPVARKGRRTAVRIPAGPHIMYKFAKKFGFADEMFKNIEVKVGDEPLIEDITREFNRGMWTIGYTGQSPERLKLHMANQHTFDRTTLQAVAVRPTATTTACRGRAGARRR